ncbi:hypothetical protein LINPERHAP1_LOCUS15670 [Linum perenne]
MINQWHNPRPRSLTSSTCFQGHPKADKEPSDDLAYHFYELCLKPQSE